MSLSFSLQHRHRHQHQHQHQSQFMQRSCSSALSPRRNFLSRICRYRVAKAHMESDPVTTSSSAPVRNKSERIKSLRFGTTHVIQPKGEHQATVVWLHGLGDVGASWAEALEELPLKNIKWIVPTAPVQPVAVMAGFPCNAWFDVGSLSEDGPQDIEGVEAVAEHIAELLSKESPNVKLGVGGFSQGAATSLYTTACSVLGKYSDGTDFPLKLNICVAISGWLPCARNLESHLRENEKAIQQAAEIPLFLAHGTADDIVLFKFGEKSAAALQSLGFKDLTFKVYKGLGHFTSPTEMKDITDFFKDKLKLSG